MSMFEAEGSFLGCCSGYLYKFSGACHDAAAWSFRLCMVPKHHMHTAAAYFQMDNGFSRQFPLRIHDMQTEDICFLLMPAVLNLNV